MRQELFYETDVQLTYLTGVFKNVSSLIRWDWQYSPNYRYQCVLWTKYQTNGWGEKVQHLLCGGVDVFGLSFSYFLTFLINASTPQRTEFTGKTNSVVAFFYSVCSLGPLCQSCDPQGRFIEPGRAGSEHARAWRVRVHFWLSGGDTHVPLNTARDYWSVHQTFPPSFWPERMLRVVPYENGNNCLISLHYSIETRFTGSDAACQKIWPILWMDIDSSPQMLQLACHYSSATLDLTRLPLGILYYIQLTLRMTRG